MMVHPLYLGGLKKGREKGSVTIRVVRKWTVIETTGQGLPLFVGMVWADAKGDAIYAEMPAPAIPKKDHLLDIGKVYAISKFRVCNAKPSFKPFKGSLMIELSEYTEIGLARDPPAAIPHYVYRLTPFSGIVPVEHVVYTYTDVLGYITSYTALETFIPKGKEKVTRLRKINIRDLSGNDLKVTLWGDQATGFSVDGVYDESVGNVVVLLLLGSIPRREYDDYDKVCLSGSSSCCYYFNPQIPEAIPIYDSFKDVPIYIERPAPTAEEPATQIKDRPLEQKTLAELHLIDPFDFEDGTYKCAVTVTAVAANSNWWYRSCKPCKKAAMQQPDGVYRCPGCQSTNITPRYLLPFTARDETAEARFFAYDEEAKQIVQKDRDAIMNPLTAAYGVPQPLQDIIGKKYVFSIDLKDDKYATTTDKQYLVKAVLEKPARRAAAAALVASRSNQELIYTAPISTIPAGTSAAPHHASQVQNELLQIGYGSPSTPIPSIDLQQSSIKNTENRSSRGAVAARRSLLGALTATDKELADDDGVSTVHAADCSPDTEDPLLIEPPLKRTKIADEHGASVAARGQSSTQHPST